MIKVLACLFMFIDHVGLVFFPNIVEFRLIGRLSMPLFAFALANGIHRTLLHNSFRKYFFRMTVFSLLSQIPYMIMVNELKGNIGFLWLTCMIFIYFSVKKTKVLVDYVCMYLCIVFLALVPVDYGLYGLGFVLIVYHFLVETQNLNITYLMYFGLHGLKLIQDFEGGLIQLFTLPTIPLMKLLSKYDFKLGKYFFYYFYPLHMIFLVGLKYLLIK